MGEAGVRRTAVELKTKAEIERMKQAGRMAANALKIVGTRIEPGVTTEELDKIAEKFIRQAGGIPTFIGYRGYPATLCVSINDEVVHGIPGSRKIKAGDLVSVDVAVTLDGFVGDNAATFPAGKISSQAENLMKTTSASLVAAIESVKQGARLGDVGFAVQRVAEAAGFGVVRDFVGHGIGRAMHEEPAVPNYGAPGTGIRLETGLVLAIEPMITAGDWKVQVLDDGWTVVTQDGSLAAHFEHTVALTKDGPMILTTPD